MIPIFLNFTNESHLSILEKDITSILKKKKKTQINPRLNNTVGWTNTCPIFSNKFSKCYLILKENKETNSIILTTYLFMLLFGYYFQNFWFTKLLEHIKEQKHNRINRTNLWN